MTERKLPFYRDPRIILIVLIVVFTSPLFLAWLFHRHHEWLPESVKSYGELVTPVQAIGGFSLRTSNGEEFTAENIKHLWTVIYTGDAQCGESCQTTLEKIRDARFAQSGEALRVQYVYLVDAENLPENFSSLVEQHPKMITVYGPEADRKRLLDQLVSQNTQDGADNRVFITNPIGDLILRYPREFKGNGLLRDLRHLLRTSQIG